MTTTENKIDTTFKRHDVEIKRAGEQYLDALRKLDEVLAGMVKDADRANRSLSKLFNK